MVLLDLFNAFVPSDFNHFWFERLGCGRSCKNKAKKNTKALALAKPNLVAGYCVGLGVSDYRSWSLKGFIEWAIIRLAIISHIYIIPVVHQAKLFYQP